LQQHLSSRTHISAIPYNNVGDKQDCTINFNGRITGPIKANEEIKVISFENAWYNPTISCVKLVKVQLIYMDGSSYTYVNELAKIINKNFANSCDY
jgi:hypothetical protein